MKEYHFTIPLCPVTKKNSPQVIRAGKRYKVIPSKPYLTYKERVKEFIPAFKINEPVNIKAIYYMQTRRRVDLTNLNSALHDLLTDYGAIADDNCRIVIGTDGSRVSYDKQNPRTEVTITTMDNYNHPFDE